MKKLFIGLFFVLLSISINIGEISIDLIPDFIGYLLLISGLREFTAESGYFGKAAKLSIIFTVFSLALFVASIFGFSYSDEEIKLIPLLAEAVCSAAGIYTAYLICRGIDQLENHHLCSLNSDKLIISWKVMTVMLIIAYLTFFIPVITAGCLMVSFAFSIVFLFQFNTTKNNYNYIFNKN